MSVLFIYSYRVVNEINQYFNFNTSPINIILYSATTDSDTARALARVSTRVIRIYCCTFLSLGIDVSELFDLQIM